MGGVFLNVVHNCYNGLAYDHLGWMDDKVVEIDHTTDGPHSVDLAFFGEYDIALRRHVTVVKSAGYYIYYNLHRGINADSVTEEDRVLLHRYRQEGAIAAGSDYSTYLHEEARPSFSNETLDFAVRVCRTVTGRPNADRPFPGSVTLEIGTLDQEDSLCQEETTGKFQRHQLLLQLRVTFPLTCDSFRAYTTAYSPADPTTHCSAYRNACIPDDSTAHSYANARAFSTANSKANTTTYCTPNTRATLRSYFSPYCRTNKKTYSTTHPTTNAATNTAT